MGFTHVLVFCIVMFLLVILNSIQCEDDTDSNSQLRPTRKFVNGLTLGTARGFGKRASNAHAVNK